MTKSILKYHETYATYDLTTGGGALSAFLQTAIPVAVAAGATLKILSDWNGAGVLQFVLVAVAGVVLLAWVVPGWWFWLMRNRAETDRLVAVAEAVNVQTVTLDKEIELERARVSLVTAIYQLNGEQVAYGREIGAYPSIEIHTGPAMVWVLDGQSVPVAFAVDWWTEYRKTPGDTLPGQAAWQAYPNRDTMRGWCKALTHELQRTGLVVAAGGPYAPRWTTRDETARTSALGRVGLWVALASAGYVDDEAEQAEQER